MGFPEGWSMAAKPCDSCKSAAAALFCRADSAFLCLTCDSKIHEANRMVARHERVWLCEVCEQAPASVTCKADAAALCVTCDRDIHSANPLARRHERVPVVPFYDTAEAVIKSTATATATASTTGDDFLIHTSDDSITVKTDHTCVGDEEVPWIDLPNSGPKLLPDATEMKSIDFFFSDSDQFLDFDYPISMNAHHNLGTDSVVPVQIVKADHSSDSQFEIDFTQSKFKSYNNYNNNSSSSYTHQSLSHSVSSSSMDVGIVPDGGSISEMSHTFAQSMNNSSINLSGGSENNTIMANQGSSQLSGLDREARVLRYREKRKNRKFEKTIRYASRKAYAEMRPRIKGRFAKRTEIEIETETEVDHLFNSDSAAFMADAGGYGVVPSF